MAHSFLLVNVEVPLASFTLDAFKHGAMLNRALGILITFTHGAMVIGAGIVTTITAQRAAFVIGCKGWVGVD